MAVSLPDTARSLVAGAVLCCALVAGAAPIVRPSPDAPINLEAASSDFDYKNNTLLFRRIRITQGQIQVEAQEASATGLNFENSEWTLEGQVRITVPDGRLESSDALAKHDGFKDFVLDQLTDLRGLTCRAMFGGYGLSCRGRFFGIVHKGRLYFKVTPETVDQYKTHGMSPFHPNPKQTLKSFYEVPVDVIEDAEQLNEWAEQSVRR